MEQKEESMAEQMKNLVYDYFFMGIVTGSRSMTRALRISEEYLSSNLQEYAFKGRARYFEKYNKKLSCKYCKADFDLNKSVKVCLNCRKDMIFGISTKKATQD